MHLSLKLFRLLSSFLKTRLLLLCQVSSTGTVSFLSYKFRFCWALFVRQYSSMSCLKIFAQHGYKVPNKSHLPNSWAKTTHMLGKNNPHVGQNRQIQPVHVGQILPTCWANTARMLGKYCPRVGQIPPSVGHYGVSCCAQEASFHSQLQDSWPIQNTYLR